MYQHLDITCITVLIACYCFMVYFNFHSGVYGSGDLWHHALALTVCGLSKTIELY